MRISSVVMDYKKICDSNHLKLIAIIAMTIDHGADVTFGAEPKDYEVLEFINRNYYKLQFSPAIEAVVKDTGKNQNPKRAQRDAKKQTLKTGIGTKSQQALKLQQEQNKQEQKSISREQREAENRRLFELKQMKKREKHKGH